MFGPLRPAAVPAPVAAASRLLPLHIKWRAAAARTRMPAQITDCSARAPARRLAPPAAAAHQVCEHAAAIDAVLTELAPHVGRLPESGAGALAELEAALQRLFWAVDLCRGLGALGAVWHARQLEEDFQGARQARG